MIRIKELNLSEEELGLFLLKSESLEQLISSPSLFGNDNPLYLEVGCGNGHFLNARSQKYLESNFIGIDISYKRIIKCIVKALRHRGENLRFINGEGKEWLTNHFVDESLDGCYLNFPDPWPKRKHHKNRIFKVDFLDILHQKLKPGGFYFCATDYEEYFFEILKILEKDIRFINGFNTRYVNELEDFEMSLFEEKWRDMDKEIYYLKFIKK